MINMGGGRVVVRNKFSIVVYFIIGLAAIGIVSQLLNNPSAMFRNILIMIGIAVVIFAFLYFFIIKRGSHLKNDEMKKYKKAVKQSQRKYKHTHANLAINNKNKLKHSQQKRKSRRRASHLRVIDGTGGKQNVKNEPHIK